MEGELGTDMLIIMAVELAVLLGLIAWAGVLTWRALPRLPGLGPDATNRQGAGLFVLWYVAVVVLGGVLGAALGVDAGSDLPRLMAAMAAANVLATVLVLALAGPRLGGRAGLGLRRRPRDPDEPFGPLLALWVWVAFIPVFVAVGYLNRLVLDLLGVPVDLQSYLDLFWEDGTARATPGVWAAIVLVIPVCEELAFRGMLYGSLRRMMPPGVAMLISATLFALLHEPVVMLPVAALGLLLAWAYERSGRLLVPCVIHALHNGVTLLMVATLASGSPS